MRLAAAAGMVLLALASQAEAREECGLPDVSVDDAAIALATVTVPRAYFHDENGERLKAFVVEGDVLLAGEASDGFVCASFINGKGKDTSGYLAESDVEIAPAGIPDVADWAGDWTTGQWQNLTLKMGRKPGWVNVEGEAYWAMSEETARNGGVNMGGVAGEAPVDGGLLGFTQTDDESFEPFSEKAADDYRCAIRLRMIGTNYLAVQDNNSCGGHNVSFYGIYARGRVEFDP